MRRFPDATLDGSLQAPLVAAAPHSQRAAETHAATARSVAPYDHVPSPSCGRPTCAARRISASTSRARARAVPGDRRSPGRGPTSPLYRARVSRRRTRCGRHRTIRQRQGGLRRLFSLWEHADPGLTSLDQARREYSELRPRRARAP
jgi:hypothetical protein